MRRKHKTPAYYTVGVRFLDADSIMKVYTYRVRSRSKVHLGQALVADTYRGMALVVVVRIDKTPKDTGLLDYKYLEKKVVSL